MKQITPEKLKEILVKPGYIKEEDFEVALAESQKKSVPLEQLLVDTQLITDKNLGQAVADAFDYYFIDLKKDKVAIDLLNLIPEAVASAQKAIFFQTKNDQLYLATSNPENYDFIKQLEKKVDKKIVVYYATPFGIDEALQLYRSDLRISIEKLIRDSIQNPQNESNMVKLVNLFLEHAHANRASDIHLEPQHDDVVARFRIDGVLHNIATYTHELHKRIVFRIKIMAALRTDEHGAAQDGRFEFKVEDSVFDVRTSILPVANGENIVLRLLSEKTRRLALEELGMQGNDLEKVRRALNKSYGTLFSVGPTGSGKTTTLYAILQILNKPEVNIMTIEDPIEYAIEHIQQTQVNPSKNLTFVTGLRSIVRQDPNIIMVGEIRDKETADIAINAAMTGHLVLSTLHANDAVTTFPRLLEMDIEPFLVASSVHLIVAQRLVRKICEQCRMSYVITEEHLETLKTEPKIGAAVKKIYEESELSKIRLYKGRGCKACGNIGYSGRIGIFEVLEVSEALRPLVTRKALSTEIYEEAMKEGMTSMLYDGLSKVFKGITTFEEVVRVSKS